MPVESDVYVKFGEGDDRGGPLNLPLPLIEGDSTDETHYYWSELRNSNFGLTASDPTPAGGQGASSEDKPNKNLDRVSFTKKVDWASTQLFLKCCEGAKAKIAKSKEEKSKGRIEKVTVEVCRTAGGQKFAYLIITYYGVRVVSYSIAMSGPEPSETIELEVEKFDFEYQPTDPETGLPKSGTKAVRGIEATAGQGASASASASSSATGGGSGGGGSTAGGGPSGGGGGDGAGNAGNGDSSLAPASATEAAVGANFPGLWQGTGFGLLPD